jgi:hypothetical protein
VGPAYCERIAKSIGRRKVLNNDLPRAVNEQLSSTPRAE